MDIQFLFDRLDEFADREAIVWKDQSYSYGWIAEEVKKWDQELAGAELPAGAVISLEGDFSPPAIAAMLSLANLGAIIMPLVAQSEEKSARIREIAQLEWRLKVVSGPCRPERTGASADHPLYSELRKRGNCGLLLFSSGSSGEPKGVVHDLAQLLQKYKVRRNSKRMFTFLLFDHIGGVNTLFHVLSNGGCAITVTDRSPESICAAIARHRVQVLPTSPTFLNLLLLSDAHQHHDLSSLELITYGTEVMPEATLKRAREVFPAVEFLQTYGLSEIGIMRSKSESSDSLWVKIGGECFETRVRDGMLEIKASSAMLGYLNAPSPFTDDGWFKTGDAVEVKGDYFRILGRKSEIINVGGEKVYPAEVEGVISLMPEVEEAVVKGESNPITGNLVAAYVRLTRDTDPSTFRGVLKAHCAKHLRPYQIPQKIVVVQKELHNERFKKMRSSVKAED